MSEPETGDKPTIEGDNDGWGLGRSDSEERHDYYADGWARKYKDPA